MKLVKQREKYQKKIRLVMHHEAENGKGALLSEVILGGQDGLVNTLGVILGLTAASSDLRIIVAGGMAGAIAEAISMGAVGYTSKLAERDFYNSELNREEFEIDNMPEIEREEIREIYRNRGFKGELLEEVVDVITSDRKVWLETMMSEELNLAPVEKEKPLKSAVLIGVSALIGSLIPIFPFLIYYYSNLTYSGAILHSVYFALLFSAIVLFVVGVVKSKLTVGKWFRSGMEMLIIGILSALVGYLIGALFGSGV